ncbi:MAG: hypothetical protein ACE1Z6_08925 [Candidatus Methylomirabilales bacterium]|nr:hypothetical protein [Acidobacteriota bacterium]MCZ6780059.1 hypothetical protein [Nitrospirota bacterium]
MAAITWRNIMDRRDEIMRTGTRVQVIVSAPENTDSTVVTYSIKDPDPGDTGNTTGNQQGNAKGGSGNSWKSFTYDDAGTAYGV